jgi:uncharacterized membrane protein
MVYQVTCVVMWASVKIKKDIKRRWMLRSNRQHSVSWAAETMGSRRKNKAASWATSSLRDLHDDGKGRALPPGNGDDARN